MRGGPGRQPIRLRYGLGMRLLVPLLLLLLLLLPSASLARESGDVGGDLSANKRHYLRYAEGLEATEHPESAYHFLADIHADIAPLVQAYPGVVTPFQVGATVDQQPIWGFRIVDPGTPATRKLLVFAQIHALEWITSEVALAFLQDMVVHPPPGVEVVVIPVLNVDGRAKVERDLRAGENKYRRGNARNVDLNRDFAVNREAKAVWRHIIPKRYAVTPGPLSQPESQALDQLAAAEGFDVAVSLHAWGGYFFHPWAGDFGRPPDNAAFVRLGAVMEGGQGERAYMTKQLGRWAFFFRGHGMEIDHLYGEYGTLAFLWELTRGKNPVAFKDWGVSFRIYNPPDPSRAVARDTGALRALAQTMSWEATGALVVSPDVAAVRREPRRPRE